MKPNSCAVFLLVPVLNSGLFKINYCRHKLIPDLFSSFFSFFLFLFFTCASQVYHFDLRDADPFTFKKYMDCFKKKSLLFFSVNRFTLEA